MARSLWSGALSFGLVNVPVRLFSGARDLDYHFHQLHEPDHARIEQRLFCSQEDIEIGWEEVARAFDLDDARQVVLSDDEMATVEPHRTRTIDIEAFVDLADLDPLYFDHPYLLAPADDNEGTARAYGLLVEVMSQTERAALGRFVMRTKEYLAIVRVRDGALSLTTMRFHDEVRPREPIATGGEQPDAAAVDQAVALIEAMAIDWRPERYEDCYRRRLESVIERKRHGERVQAPRPEREPAPVPDLMAALSQSLNEVRGDGGRRDTATRAGDLRDMSRDELYQRAQQEDVPGRSRMSKDELVDALS